MTVFVPGHSFKFAATMQADQAGPVPVLIRVETKAGHGRGQAHLERFIDETADAWGFLAQQSEYECFAAVGRATEVTEGWQNTNAT